MVLVWKTTESNDFATRLMAALFGGTPSSKLFANVREKMSLCYYCAANYVETKRAMLVDCGVEADQIQKAKEAILAQLEALQQGDFTEEELENTKTALRNSLLSVGDSTSSYTNWYFTQFCKGTYLTPEEENLRYADLTREQIMTAAQSMHLDTIYIMERQEGTSNGND
jgi:predicted Zn-dependent peptidase